VIVVAVRWYLRYHLSYRDMEELLVERGIEVDHVAGSLAWAAACIAAFGLGFGVATIARPAILAHHYGTHRYATMNTPIILAKAAAPLAAAALGINHLLPWTLRVPKTPSGQVRWHVRTHGDAAQAIRFHPGSSARLVVLGDGRTCAWEQIGSSGSFWTAFNGVELVWAAVNVAP
jgi:hypothetical protein